MKLEFTREFLLDSIRRCATAFYPHNKNEKESSPKFKLDWKNMPEDYSTVESYKRFQFATERGFMFRATIQGKKVVGINISGTYDLIGWALNFAAGKVDEPILNDTPYGQITPTEVSVHVGFHKGWLEIYDAWFDYLDEAIKDDIRTVLIEGHSRGAAIAQDAAVATQKVYGEGLGLLLPYDITAVLMAPPNIFNKAGVISYDKRVPRTIRCVYGADPVCKVPPTGMGFYPVAAHQTLRLGYEWYTAISPSEWLTNAMGAIPLLPLNAIGLGVSMLSKDDHYPTRYIDGIKKSKANFPVFNI